MGGNDYMAGGGGNDIYCIDNIGDVVVESANQGNDIVYASMDYTIGADVNRWSWWKVREPSM